MNFAQQNRNPVRHMTAVGAVALLHLVVGVALVSGLARKVVEIYRKPVDVSIVEEQVKPPPPPPPPKPMRTAAPPPAYAPPPDIPAPAVPAPAAITATTAEVPPPASAPAPVAVGAVCPNHLAVRSHVPYPPLAQRQGIGGEVLVEFTVATDGRIGNVTVVKSSHPVFEKTVVEAVDKFRCAGQAQPVRVRVPFAFRLES